MYTIHPLGIHLREILFARDNLLLTNWLIFTPSLNFEISLFYSLCLKCFPTLTISLKAGENGGGGGGEFDWIVGEGAVGRGEEESGDGGEEDGEMGVGVDDDDRLDSSRI